jgi:hypothetical protein
MLKWRFWPILLAAAALALGSPARVASQGEPPAFPPPGVSVAPRLVVFEGFLRST